VSHNGRMAKKKRPTGDRHKKRKMTAIREPLATIIEDMAKRYATDPTELVNRAVREMLEREKLWPPHPSHASPTGPPHGTGSEGQSQNTDMSGPKRAGD
jgi:hypothetical protein